MEVALALFSAGFFLLALTIWRARKLEMYSPLLTNFHEQFDIQKLKSSKDAEYNGCFAHRWVMEEITRAQHGRIIGLFRNHVRENTLFAALWISFLLAASSLLFVFVLTTAVGVLGFALPVFGICFLLALGSNSLNESEQLLSEIQKKFPLGISAEDYPYVKIAYVTLKRWVLLSASVATLLLVLAPFGRHVSTAAAYTIAQVSRFVLWQPAFYLLEYSVVLPILYLGLAVVLISYAIIIASRIMVGFFGSFRETMIHRTAQNVLEEPADEKEQTGV